MANRNEESGREQSAYGRSGNPVEREQSRGQVAGENPQWRESQAGQQHYRQGASQGARQQYGAAGSGGSGQYDAGERASQERESWESERGSDFYAGRGYGQGAQEYGQAARTGSQSTQGYGQQQGSQGFQRSPSYGQGEASGQGFGQPGYSQGRPGSGQGDQQDWQRGMQQQHGRQAGWQGYNEPAQPGLREGSGMYGDQAGMSGSYGSPSGQQFGYGGGLGYPGASGQRGFRGMGPKNYSRSDERIKEDVCEHLTQDDELDASEIEVKAEQGVVSLEGTVAERWMKHRAEDIAESCSGVREVENRIRVESSGKRRSSQESLGSRSGGQGEGRTQPGTLGSSGASASTGKFPH